MIKFKQSCISLMRLFIGPLYSMIFTLPKIASAPSYDANAPRKPLWRRYIDLVVERIVTGSTNHFYSAYGLDLRNKSFRDIFSYVSEKRWWKFVARNTSHEHNSTVCLRNKLMFFIFCRGAGLPTANVFAASIHSHRFLFQEGFQKMEVSENAFQKALLEKSSFFYKGAGGCCARSVAKIDVRDGQFYDHHGTCDLDRLFEGESVTICQAPVVQHPALAALNPTSVNTIRIITIRDSTGAIHVFDSLLRVGGTEASVDNWAAGGLAIHIDDGKLDAIGYYKATLKKTSYIATYHPISGIEFNGYEIPFYSNAIALAKRAHGLLSDLTVVGWDVAISPEGPVLIEGNDDPEITLHQIACRQGFAQKLAPFENIT